jgi:aldehyde dehydrogenase (NAD+)
MQEILKQLGIDEENKGASTGTKWITAKGKSITSISPVDGKKIATLLACDDAAYEEVIASAQKAFEQWKMWPSPRRGDVVRQIGDALRKNKDSTRQIGLL